MKLTDAQYIELGKRAVDFLDSLGMLRGAFGAAMTKDNPVYYGDVYHEQSGSAEPDVIIIEQGATIPWLVEAQKWEGYSEVFDQEELTEFLGVNPNDKDGGQAWCADFINAVMRDCGIEGTGSSAAVSFEHWGTPCECVDGAIAVYGPGKLPGGHVGIVQGFGLFGGNQGDLARFNKNRAWFEQNKTLLGYRCPPGYLLEAA